MPAVYDFEHVVAHHEIDGLGHVHNLAYLQWMLDAALAHSTVQGWPAQRYLDLGAGWVVRSHHIDYLRPAFAAEPVVVRTWVSSFRRLSSIRKYRILRRDSQTLLASAETNWAFVSYDQFLPQRIPAEIIASFQLVPPDQEP